MMLLWLTLVPAKPSTCCALDPSPPNRVGHLLFCCLNTLASLVLLPHCTAHQQVSDVLAQLTQQDDLVAAAQALGYSVRLRDCVGGGQGVSCLQNLRHSFLILSPSAHAPHARHGACYPSEEIVIDPTFKDNFVIAHPSPRYSAVLEAVPVVFVGSLSRVQPLVAALCSEMALAFKEAGSVMPPWRTTRSMMTKWMPRKSLDLPLGASAGGPVSTHHAAAVNPAGGPAAAAACHASTGAAAGLAGGRAVRNSTRLLRQACHAAEAAEHSPLAPSSAASGMRSASSSNCSSTSATPVVSVGCDSAAASPTTACGPVRPDLLPAAEAPTAAQQAAADHSSGHAVHVPAAKTSVLRSSSAAQQVVKCFEPLTRVVGGFGFCSTPL